MSRDQAKARAESLPEGDTLRKRLAAFADAMETERTDLVSTSRGEGISGEEKLREELGMLYGNVNGYEGRPTASQLERMQILEKDLEAAAAHFEKAADKELPSLNEALAERKLEPLRKLSEEEWRKR